jgi:hypothetical protein
MEEIKIAPAKFWVIAAYKSGDCGFMKYWKCTPLEHTWVDDISLAKHYSAPHVARRELNAEHTYFRCLGKDLMMQQYGDVVKFAVMEATAQIVLKPM